MKRALHLLPALVLLLGSCAALDRDGLDDMVQGAIEVSFPDLRAHQSRSGRPLPVVMVAVVLDDPDGIADDDLRADYFELMHAAVTSPRKAGLATTEPSALVLERLTEVVGREVTPDEAWQALADAGVRGQVVAACERAGRPVDYVMRATLRTGEVHWLLDLEIRDLADWTEIRGTGRYVR